MKNLDEKLDKYADLLVEVGLNVQKDGRVFVRSSVDALPLIRRVTEKAYEKGAKEVKVSLSDDTLTRLHADYQTKEELSTIHQWAIDERMHYSDEKAGFLSITSSSPELLKGVDPEKLQAMQIAAGNAFKDFSNRIQSDYHSWCVAGYPSVEWAKLVFPDKSDDEAVEALLDLILYTVRADVEDPVEAWEALDRTLHEKVDYLNDKKYKALRYEAPGTDFVMGLPQGHLWAGASSVNEDGERFMANMPTEEVFSVPEKTGMNGYVSNTLPLSYGGNIIDDFKLTFKDGKVVDFEAGRGYEVLENLLNTDEGSRYLGEVALVPHDSPISNTGKLFYNTLFDENASCHIALGSAYAFCLEGGKSMSREELEKAGLNDSISHVDFMIGSDKLDIYGIDDNGNETKIFEKGNWAF
ncbi:aminopeptidase [Salinicoccus halodurans]|uniref:Aminopeptidase n=1 Tax=Salinicoccus halodurans TaxID=407035 RepID=A0A0F7HMV8_9STAP|nr:aminopeptidase [Salinicoccus halodurans]AKG74479.1 aminopeptidase T [Salinicoccus halodurans]SFK91019.1 aminopeptidase [Salinicoccus halodurans]